MTRSSTKRDAARRIAVLTIAVVGLAGCYTRSSMLTTMPLATPMAAHGARGDVTVTGRVGTAVETAQGATADDVFVPRGQLEATGTIRFTRWFGLRPILELGFAQGALLQSGPGGPAYSGTSPTIVGGPGLLFRIEPTRDVDVDLELDPLVGATVQAAEVCYATCAPLAESYRLVVLPRGAATVTYAFDPIAGAFLGFGLATQPTYDSGLAVIPIARVGGYVSPADFLDVTLDVQWPFAGTPGLFGPTVALGARFHFGAVE